eukprot:TRINITY_DN15486_c0_g1_i1.p1 TRINITY_DN15486_c0_g1~~TRINITY_DN15486_c0_g1_i1.p1  ORF type:complete len:138 (+),score=19.64 TRINITY_DN15486_c0_g1_i1:383-796(+)
MEAKPSYFWSGILTLNGNEEHAFYDVKVKNQGHLAYQVFTSDLPPIPVGKNDTLRVLFQLENNSGGNQRYAICEGTFSGNLLEGTDHQQGNVVSVESDSAEWHFIKQNSADSTAWLLCFVCLRIPASGLKKFMPYIS